MSNLDYILNTPVSERGRTVDHIVCVDGATISVQGSSAHYCDPRDDQGPWAQVECGFPSVAPQKSMLEYCQDSSRPTDTVYAWVPVEVVREYVALHGGEVQA